MSITYDQIKAVSDGIVTTNIKGKEYAAKIRDKALREKGRISFNGKMNKRKDDKSIITDSCMSPEEF